MEIHTLPTTEAHAGATGTLTIHAGRTCRTIVATGSAVDGIGLEIYALIAAGRFQPDAYALRFNAEGGGNLARAGAATGAAVHEVCEKIYTDSVTELQAFVTYTLSLNTCSVFRAGVVTGATVLEVFLQVNAEIFPTDGLSADAFSFHTVVVLRASIPTSPAMSRIRVEIYTAQMTILIPFRAHALTIHTLSETVACITTDTAVVKISPQINTDAAAIVLKHFAWSDDLHLKSCIFSEGIVQSRISSSICIRIGSNYHVPATAVRTITVITSKEKR
ncbi:hypothetical protein ACFL21_04510 [Patescibacteria group bacterium]